MKFDTVIIGGGLAGLVSGIRLQKAGQKTAIISAGQSAMHFSSGTFDLLNRMPSGEMVEHPLKAIASLSETHPYSKVGAAEVAEYSKEVKSFFAGCGIELTGEEDRNSYRITPVGEVKPCWLKFEDFTLMSTPDAKIGSKILIVNIFGYLDFNTKFLASAFEKSGAECRIVALKTDKTERLRKNPTEMRSTNISKLMENEENWREFVKLVKSKHTDEDVIVLPAVFGIRSTAVLRKIKNELGKTTFFIATMPPSVPGIRTQMQLKNEYVRLGGEFLMGDTVCGAEMADGKVKCLSTSNLEEVKIAADNFILASGSFFSKGLVATPYQILEPVFGLDVDYAEDRADWYDLRFFNKQNYMGFGVKTDKELRTSKDGKTIDNLYAVGSVLSGANTLYEGCGGGVAIMTAFRVADRILNK